MHVAKSSVLIIAVFADVRHGSLALVSNLVSGDLRFTNSVPSVHWRSLAFRMLLRIALFPTVVFTDVQTCPPRLA